MKREIKFRGLSKAGTWLYGLPAYDNDNALCIAHKESSGWYLNSIQEDTLSEFTGYSDYNNKEIYEGDIIRSINGQIEKAVIEFHNASFWIRQFDEFYGEWHNNEMWWEKRNENKIEVLHWSANRIALEVISNIYENIEDAKIMNDHPNAVGEGSVG